MAPRLHCPIPLVQGGVVELPASAARHAQVLRLQPGSAVTLFGGAGAQASGGEFEAVVERMGRQAVSVRIGAHRAVEREAANPVHVAAALCASERMDWLVEKATELGAAGIQPLVTERTAMRLAAERAVRRREHWQAIAVAACEQCGRNRVPPVQPVMPLDQWLRAAPWAPGAARMLLSPAPDAAPLGPRAPAAGVVLLSGPEGGLTDDEQALAIEAGFAATRLGPRILRAETAPLAALAVLTATGAHDAT